MTEGVRKQREILAIALKAARSAGEIIAKIRRDGTFQVSRKDGERNLVTIADLEAEQEILRIIREAYPDHEILSEESLSSTDRELGKGPLWVIDPVDGTTNYAQGHVHVGVSIAYAEDGVVQVGVVHAPFLEETFTAMRGVGAWRNNQPITCSQATRLVDALVATGFPYERTDLALILRRVSQVLNGCRDIRRLGAASIDICWTACGRLDVFYETLAPWDFAAGALIAREAGATVGHIGGPPPGLLRPLELWGEHLLIAPPQLFTAMERLLLDSDQAQ